MAFDGLVSYTIIHELKDCIIGGKIDKIFEPNKEEILLGIYNNGLKYALNVSINSSNYRICLTTNSKPNPDLAPNFCMLLRKYLLNTKIINISMPSLERIVIIEFEGSNKTGNFETNKLIIELMGKHSNVILVNSKNIIIDSLKHFNIQNDNDSYRNVLPNYKYIFPICNKLDFSLIKDANDFYSSCLKYIDNDSKMSDAITNTYTGISKTSVDFILKELKLEDVFNINNSKKIYEYLLNLINNPNYSYICNFDNDYSVSYNKAKSNLQANFFIDDYYLNKETKEEFINSKNNLSKLLLDYTKKVNRKLLNINQKLTECKNTDLYRIYGELITNNLYKIDNNSHLDNINLENYYDNNNLINIPLDKSISPYNNAKKYFKKYNKLKNARKIIEIQKLEVEEELKYLESLIYEFECANNLQEINSIYNEFSENILNNNKSSINNSKKQKKLPKKKHTNNKTIGEPLKFEIDGFKVLVGKNNIQNDYITKHAEPTDIWFHTKNIHGSHTILKTNGKIPNQRTINKCASIAAFYSKAKQSTNVPVDYTYIKFVKKMPKSKPGMVIYTNYKNVIVKPISITDLNNN